MSKGRWAKDILPELVGEENAEMINDIKAYDLAKKENDEYFPFEVVSAIANKESSVKVYREYRKMTQQNL